MTRKPSIHGWWQYICHSRRPVDGYAIRDASCPTSSSQTLRISNSTERCSRLPVPSFQQTTGCLSGARSRTGNLLRHDVTISSRGPWRTGYYLGVNSKSYSTTPRVGFGHLHRVPGYASSRAREIDSNKRTPRPPPYAGASHKVSQDEALKPHEPTEEDSLGIEPLFEEGVPPSNPARMSRLYDELLKYAAAGRTQDVSTMVTRLVTENREKPNLKLYNALVLVNTSMSDGSAAAVAAILKEMDGELITPDTNVYHNALKVLAVHPDCILRASVLADMRKRWFTLTESGWHDVVAGYTREGLIEQAIDSLDSMRKARVRVQGWLYDMIIYTLCDINEIDAALTIMKDRVTYGENMISMGSWFYLFDIACSELHYDTLRFIWRRRVEQQQLNPTSGQCLQVLTAAARHGDVQVATDVFRILSKRATTFESQHYELLIEAYVEAGDLKTALTILCIMNEANLTPTQSATSSILKFLKQSPERPRMAFDILNELKTGRQVPTEAMNRIIEACVQHNGLHQAIEMYSSLRNICPTGPNAATFNSLLVGCRQENRKDTAMFLVSEMLEMKIRPNVLTYDRLILICLPEKDYEDAFRYYEEMRNAGMTLREGTMVAIIKRCCDARDDRAYKLLEVMRSLGMDDSHVRRYVIERFPSILLDPSRGSFRNEAMASNS